MKTIKLISRLINAIINRIKCVVDPNKYAIELGVKLGSNVKFYSMKPGMFSTEPWLIKIGDNCHITDNCIFTTHDGGVLIIRNEIPDLEITAPIIIGNDVFIGENTTILFGTKIGNRSIIGACSLVKGEFPDNSVIAGVPAKVIESVDEYRDKAAKKSLHLGHLDARDKDIALREFYKGKGW